MKKSILSKFLSLLLVGTAFSALGAVNAYAAEEKVLNVYNWSDYIAEDTLAKFTKKTGIKVNYDVYDSNDILEGKLLAGSTGYDVVVPSATFLARQIQAGIFQPLDKSTIPNFHHLDPDINALLSTLDPDNRYSATYLWGTTGLGYNVKEVQKRLGSDAPVDSWDLFFDPKYASKMADCGITLLDAYDEVVPIALNYLNLRPQSQRSSDFKKAGNLLQSVRPHIRYFHSSQYINDLANGDVCVSIGWSGDIIQARDRAIEANNGVDIAYVIPKEGTPLWFDLMAIPTDAPHPKNAHKFINFVLTPQITADISNYVFYANGNAAATPLVSEEVTSDPGIYPTKAAKKNLYLNPVYKPKTDRTLSRLWTKIKTGQ